MSISSSRRHREDNPLFTPEGTAKEPLQRLLRIFDITDVTITAVKAATQKEWYQAGKLRAEIAEEHGAKKDQTEPIFRELSLLDEVRAPRDSRYPYGVVLGATVVAVRKRLALLKHLWEQDAVRVDSVVLLGSDRLLLPDKESAAVLLNHRNADFPFSERDIHPELPRSDEAEMMNLVYQQVLAGLPWGEKMPVQLTRAKREAGKGNPNTGDIARAWIEQHRPPPGTVLALSSQPYVSYQGLVLEEALGSEYSVTGVGYGTHLANVTQGLDALAKLIYEFARHYPSAK